MAQHETIDTGTCMPPPTTETHELSVTRLIKASPETVYRTWTERTAEWFAPKPYTTPKVEMDLRPGGRFYCEMRSPEGQTMPHGGIFLEVIPNRKIVTTDAFTDGWTPQQPFMVAIATFEPEAGGTRFDVRVRHWSEEAKKRHEAMGFHEGWGICISQLAELAEA